MHYLIHVLYYLSYFWSFIETTGEEVSRNIPGTNIESQVIVHGNQTQAGRDLKLGRDSYHFDAGAQYNAHIHIHPSIQGQYILIVDLHFGQFTD